MDSPGMYLYLIYFIFQLLHAIEVRVDHAASKSAGRLEQQKVGRSAGLQRFRRSHTSQTASQNQHCRAL